jgi:hypothetical protein
MLFIFWPRPDQSRTTTFVMDGGGTLHFHGVSLANTNVRDLVFKVMGKAGIQGTLAITREVTNQTQFNNVISTLRAMSQAGVMKTNTPAKTSPFE